MDPRRPKPTAPPPAKPSGPRPSDMTEVARRRLATLQARGRMAELKREPWVLRALLREARRAGR